MRELQQAVARTFYLDYNSFSYNYFEKGDRIWTTDLKEKEAISG